MCDDMRFVRQHPLESFVHAQKVTNINIRWLSCACSFCPLYVLLLFAIHSLDVRGSYVVQSEDWNLNIYTTHKPTIMNCQPRVSLQSRAVFCRQNCICIMFRWTFISILATREAMRRGGQRRRYWSRSWLRPERRRQFGLYDQLL